MEPHRCLLLTLFVVTGIFMVPSQAQVVVETLGIYFNDGTNVLQEGSSSHLLNFNVSITLAAGSNDAVENGNMDRWSLALQVQDSSGVACATAAVPLTPAQAGVAILASGRGTLPRVNAFVDLSGCLCSSATELLLNLTSNTYTLMPEPTTINASLTCNGLIGSSLTVVTSGVSVVENENLQAITLNILGNSESQGRSISNGGNFYAVEVYVATGNMTHNTPIEATRTKATIPSSQVSTFWTAGSLIKLSDITLQLNLMGVGSCSSINVLCTSLTRDPMSTLEFSIEGGSIVSCSPIVCIGVLINQLIPAFTSEVIIKQGESNLGLDLTVTIKADSTKATVTGLNLWGANVFGNAKADCSDPTQVPATVDFREGTNYGLDINSQSVWSSLLVDLDMRQYGCNNAQYICVEALKGTSPTPEFSLSFNPDSSKYGAVAVSCEGLVVASGSFSVTSDLAAFKDDHTLQFSATFTSSASSGGVTGSDLWELVVYPAENNDNTGRKGQNTTVLLQTSQLSTAFSGSGGTLMFQGLTATISLVSDPCGTYNYICGWLSRKATASPNFKFTPLNSPSCSQLLACKNVIFTSSTVTAAAGSSPNGLPLYEGVSDQDVYMDIALESDQLGGSVPSGTSLWQFTVAPGNVLAELTDPQKNALMTAGEMLSFTRVKATLDLSTLRCNSFTQVCAEIMTSNDRSLNFLIDSAPARNMGCFTPECQGVEITSLVIENGVTNFNLKEGTQNHMLTFSVTARTNPEAGSVRGSNLWKMLVYLSMSDGTKSLDVSADAMTGPWESQDVLASAVTTTFENVQVSLNLDTTCANMRFLCVELRKATVQDFLLEPTLNSLQTCRPVSMCNGIVLDSISVSLGSGAPVIEGILNNPEVEVSIGLADTSTSVTGSNIWMVTIYGSDNIDGNHDPIENQTSITSGNSNAMNMVPLDGISWNIDMTGLLCAEVTHICVDVKLVANASYSLLPRSYGQCFPLECQGIVIVSEAFTLIAPNIFEAIAPDPQSLVTTTISAQASGNGASIPDDTTNIWEVSLFLNSASNGSGVTFDTASPTLSLSPQDQRQGISSANPLTFGTNMNFEFTLDVLCGSALYVCLEISEQTGASPNYDITFPPTPTCQEIMCTGVVFTSANLTFPADTRLIENNPTQRVRVTLRANTAPITATLQQGSNFWQLNVFVSTQPNPTESQRYAQTTASLTQTQKDMELLASDTLELADIYATVNLRDFVCPSPMIYLCVELQRDPQSMHKFTIQGSPSPLLVCESVECQGVLITSIDIEGIPPAIIENEPNPLNLNVTVGVGGADASGSNLWRMQASLVYNGAEISTVDVNLGSQASADVVSGQPITFSDLMVPFDLSQTVCPGNETLMLCLELSRAGIADANFTVTGEPTKCVDVPCLGVVIVQSSVRASMGDLLESRASNPITLDVSYTSYPNGGSIAGTDLWSVTVFGNSREDGSGTRMAETTSILPGNDANFPLAKGQTVDFNGLTATLDLRPYLVCEEVRWVCAELNKGAAPSMDFTLTDKNNARVTCTNIDCTGVQISSTQLTTPTNPMEFIEDSWTTSVDISNIAIVGGPMSSTLPNRDTNLKVFIFGNSMEDISGQKVAETELPISLAAQGITPDMTTILQGTAELNLTDVFCADLKYLCVRVGRSDNAPYPFKFEGVPNENSLIDCAAITCAGVRVSSGAVETTAVVREGDPDYPIKITVEFNTDPSGASVRVGTMNIWKLEAFLATTADGMAPRTPDQNVSLPQSSESQPVPAGSQVTFEDAVARIDTTAWICQPQNFICVRLLGDPAASANYKVEGWNAGNSDIDPSKLQACTEISCRGVDITNVEFQTNQSLYFLERDDDSLFTTNIGLVVDPEGGGVIGTGLWNLTFMLNSQPDGTGEQYCTVTVATLSEDNTNRAVDPNGPVTVLQDVNVTLSLGDVLCSNSSAFYLCVKVSKAAGSDPDFTLTVADWSCTQVTCYPVRVSDVSFQVTTPSYIVENTNNYLHIDLNVTVDPISASISGTGLWASPSFEMRDADNATILTSSSVYWIPDRQDTALSAGETAKFDNIFPVTFSPSGTLCNQLTKLCMTFEKGDSPTPDFGLEFLTPNEICVDIACRGVEIISTVISSITAGDTVTERHPTGQDISITVTSLSSADGASISGTNLWSVTIYYTPNANGDVDATIGSAEADLTNQYKNRELVAGTNLVLENVEKASLDVLNLVCPQGDLYLCARLERNSNPDPDPLFTLSPYDGSSAAFIGCKTVTCISVEMEETTTTIGLGVLIPVERTSNHVVQFSFSSTPSGRTAELMGNGLWRLRVFGNRRQDGSHHKQPYEEGVALTTAQMDMPVDPPQLIFFSAREVRLNLEATPCRHTPYFCGQLLKGTNPSPNFSLHGNPDDSRLINCMPLDCTGVKIATFELTNTGSEILRENQANQLFIFDVQLTSDSAKSAVSGDDLWTFRAYLNDAPDCLGIAEEVALTTASMRAGQEDQDLAPGGLISFNVDALVDYGMKCPPWNEVYICLEVFVGDTSTTPFTLFGDIVKGTKIECRGVEVTQTLIRDVNRGERVLEEEDNLEFDLNLRVSSDAEASSIRGTGLWSVDIFTSDTMTCQKATTGPITSQLSMFNRNKMLTAGGTLLLNNIQATVPRGDTLCDDIGYVCARLAKGPNRLPDFTLVPKPDESALLGVAAIDCIGLRIISTSVGLTEGEPLISNDPQHAIALSFVFSTDPLGSSVRNPTNLFRLEVAATDTPSRAGVVASQHRALVPYNPPGLINIAAGQTFTLPLQANLNLNGARCEEIPYVCVTLMKGVNAAPPFTLAPNVNDPVRTACTERLDCVGVRVVDQDLEIKSGIPFLEHAMSNPVELVVSLTAGEVSGNAVGMNLWSAEVKLSFEDPLAPGTQFYAVTMGTFVGDDESKSLPRGQTVEYRLEADLNLDGVACSATPYLVVNITNPNANPEFTLEWNQRRDYIVVSKTFSCVGVSFDSVSLSVSDGFPLHELAPNNHLTFSVDVAVNATSATVTGTNLWEVRAFISSDPNGAGVPESAKQSAVLDAPQGAVTITASAVSTIHNINVYLDTAGKYCSDMTYLCVEVWRGSAAQPYYNVKQPANRAGLRSCRMTRCNGVVVDSVRTVVSSEPPLIEMRPNQEVTLDLTIIPTQDSAGIDGNDLWAATVFVSPNYDGSDPRASVVETFIPADQRSRDLPLNSQLTLEGLRASMDFTGIPCSQMSYICVTLRDSDQAQPDFNIAGGNALTNCTRTNCISVAIASASLTLVSNEILERDMSAMFSFDASFLPWMNSRALQEDNSWQLRAYASDRGDRFGKVNAPQIVSLTDVQEDQGVVIGTPLAFNIRTVTLDVSSLECAATGYLCVNLETQPGVPFILGGYTTAESLVDCVQLRCFPVEVNLYSTEVTERLIRVEFTEAFGDFNLYVLTYSPKDGITSLISSIPRNLERRQDFDQLVPGKQYTIQLTLQDGDQTKAGPFELVERTRPDPVKLELDSVSATELTVFWDEADGIFEYYIINIDPQDNSLPLTPRTVYPYVQRRVSFTELLSAKQYNVTIYTVSGDKQSLPSTVIANTDPSTPDLTTTGNAETTVDLEWFIDRRQVVDQFEIRYEPSINGIAQPLIYPKTVTSTTITDLVPGRKYDFTLVAVSNINGVVEIRSAPATESVQTLPKPPAEITYEDATETSIRILWPSSEGDLDYYIVFFTPTSDLSRNMVPRDNPRDMLYEGLDVASEYTVVITSHVTADNGELVSRPVQRTVSTLPYPPGAISIIEVTTTTIEFRWLHAPGPRTGYEVTFNPNEPEFMPQSTYFTTGNTMRLSGIKPHVTVDFQVRTKVGDVSSQPRELRQRTFPTVPGPVRDFEITGLDTNYIEISFKIPESPNGLILAYLVSISGTKPGQPDLEPTFQTITAFPNDVQFNQIISPLVAGYTYTLSIRATNTEGSGEPVTLAPVTLPIKAPHLTGVTLPNNQFILEVTSSTIRIRIPRSLFSDRNGLVTAYTVLVVGAQAANQTAGPNPPSFQQIRNNAVKPVYQTSEPLDLFNVARRRRRQTVTADSVDFVVGEETNCPSFGYCNGPLDPITQYRVRIRAATENGLYTDAPWSDVISTSFDPWWFVYALIPFIIIVFILAFIMCLCSLIIVDKKKQEQPKKQAPRKESSGLPKNQANENSSNNTITEGVSQERLVPDSPQLKRGPTSRPVAVVKFGDHVHKMSARSGENFAREFEDLNLLTETESKTVGALPQNVDKNRFGNIIPYDFNRVCLNNEEDYINASFMSGFNCDDEYIAAQGPQANSVNDFWQMIWEQNVPIIAVLGNCVERGRVKFAQYWPTDFTPITFGDVTVNKVSEREEAQRGYIVRDLCIESGSEVRSLRQFQFTDWPIHGVPKKSEQMLHFIRTVRSKLSTIAGPLLVHCGAGIGRTGVFIVLDILTQHLAVDDDSIDVFGTVASKRKERTNMVQTELQYEFVHRAMLDILEGRVTGPNWLLKSKRRGSTDSDKQIDNDMAEASM